ncbi:hypothetical protein CAPTEDRAFT_145671, partial [Capitella teleta]
VRRFPPEMVGPPEHTSKSDVWVMAILFWEVISGKEPYDSLSDQEVCEAILGKIKPENPINCDTETFNLMNKCWMFNPENRPSATEVSQEIDVSHLGMHTIQCSA